jgi:DNA polymerase III subunit alpha
MFATLDDLEGSVEVLVFGKTLAEWEPQVDQIVLVRGRVDHGDKGTSLIAQAVEPFAPSEQEVQAAREAAAVAARGPEPVEVRLDAKGVPASVLDELKHILGNHVGESEFVLRLETSCGLRTLRFGEGFRVKPTPSLRAELASILGPAALRAG